MKLTAVILSKNEEKNIKECIKSLDFCDEVVVVDDFSDDKTRKIASDFGARVYRRNLSNDFSRQRNFGLEKAKGEWVLFIDSDERVSPELSFEINTEIKKGSIDGYFLKRVDRIWGKEIKHGEPGNIKLLRLARKNLGKWVRGVHEKWEVKGRTRDLKNPIIHYPHQNLSEFIYHVNYFSALHAEENLKEGKKSNIFKIVIYPKLKFVKSYFINLGFLDGIHGFVIALIMSMHSYLSWTKLWTLQNKKS